MEANQRNSKRGRKSKRENMNDMRKQADINFEGLINRTPNRRASKTNLFCESEKL